MKRTGIQKFKHAVEILNGVYNEIPIQQILLFLEVAEAFEITQSELTKRLSSSPASLSRNIKMLSYYKIVNPLIRYKHLRPSLANLDTSEVIWKGHGLIERRYDINNCRTLVIGLTTKGEEIRDKIEAAIADMT